MSTVSFLFALDAVPINTFKGDNTWENVMGLQDKASKTYTK